LTPTSVSAGTRTGNCRSAVRTNAGLRYHHRVPESGIDADVTVESPSEVTDTDVDVGKWP
jgi:hypothetical protein